MSKKKLLEFGLKEADAFQKNFKIIFDRLVEGYRRFMGKDPEGVDLLKVKMEAREKAINSTKVVNQKGLTLDPDKPIIGGTQEGIETIKIKELDDVNLSKDDPMGDLEKIIKGEGDTGLPKEGLKSFKYKTPYEFSTRKEYEKYLDEMLGPDDDVFGNPMKDQMLKKFDELELKNVTPRPTTELFEEALGVRLHGDETFGELMEIKETGVHPRGEPPIKKADGGRIGFSRGGTDSIIGEDIGTIGTLGTMGVGGLGTLDDEFSDIAGQTAGLGVLSGLTKIFGPKLGEFIFQRGRKKVIDKVTDTAIKKAKEIEAEKAAVDAARRAETQRIQSRLDRDPRGTGPRSGRGNPYGGGRGGVHSDYADGGLATMFVEKR